MRSALRPWEAQVVIDTTHSRRDCHELPSCNELNCISLGSVQGVLLTVLVAYQLHSSRPEVHEML